MVGAIGRFGRAAAAALELDADTLDVVTVDEGRLPWASAFPVAELALDSVMLASALMDRVVEVRCGRRLAPIVVDPARVAASFGSERLLRVDGRSPDIWAPLSGFWATSDGWVRTHANYPHHAGRLRALLGLSPDSGADEMSAAVAGWSRFELEEAAITVGAVVAAVRGAEEWEDHPQCPVLDATPLVQWQRTGAAPAGAWRGSSRLPLAGVRVLDLTRVIAGPVAARDLALAGADVLRIDSPHLPEPHWQHLDTGQQKRSTLLDLEVEADRERFHELLAEADVVVAGYRPGALERFGVSAETLAETHPGLVLATVSAWGETGPWGARRGFDSIVQATIGIALAEQAARGADAPGALPVQALDHASGHLLAAAIAAALVHQRAEGGSHHVSVALARTGWELMRHRGSRGHAADAAEVLPTASLTLDDGTVVTGAPPVLAFAGAPAEYSGVHPWGSDAPGWRDADIAGRAGGR